MIRPKRKAIPVGVKLEVALRELGLQGVAIEWDHVPALGLRPVDPETGDYDPPQNDPDYIQILLVDEHGEKTKLDLADIAVVKRKAGETGQQARLRRREHGTIQSQGFQTNRDGKWKKPFRANAVRRD